MKSVPIKSQNCVGATLVALLCLLSFSSAEAQLENFNFTIVSDPLHSNVDGTITGEIIGVQNNASSIPSDVIITSAPAGIGFDTSVPYSLKDNGWNLSAITTDVTIVGEDRITVSDSAVTSDTMYGASLASSNAFLDFNVSFYDESLGSVAANGLNNGAVYDANFDGFSGATYTLVSTPEPSTWTMLLGGLGVLAFWRLRRRTAN